MFDRSEALYDAIYGWKDYETESERVDQVILERLPKARTILDVACGTGKHLDLLRRKGYKVAGVDLDPKMLAAARTRLGPGVPLHVGNMVGLDLSETFDVVMCLFASIGYVRSEARLREAVGSLASHARPGGLVLVEPFFTPDSFEPGHPWAVFVDQPDLKLARMDVPEVRDGIAILNFSYLVATPEGVEHFTELHELGLFTVGQFVECFQAAGLEVTHDPEGLMGRGLYIGMKSSSR